jgi:paraquat-inducible protein A
MTPPLTPLIVCEHCDSVYRKHPLKVDEIARCGRCDAVLYRASRLSVGDLLALTVAAAITFVIANVSPVIRIEMGGVHNEVTLWQSVMAMDDGYAVIVGVLAGATLFFVPLLQIVLLGWVLLFARVQRRAPGFAFSISVLHAIRPWSMTEVFLLGVLVAIVKLAGLLDVIAGPGTYATVALTFLITLIAKRDVRPLWDHLPSARA